MQLETGSKQDLAHRLHAWALANKLFLILVLIGGIGFFGMLAGLTLWYQTKEEKGGVERFGLIEEARQAFQAQNWEACIQHYQGLYLQAKDSSFYRVLALHGIGTCQRGAGDFKASAQTFERAALEPGHADPSASRQEATRSLEMVSQTNEIKKER